MKKYHLKNNGEPGLCQAIEKPCPYANNNQHFQSLKDARQKYEEIASKIENTYKDMFTDYGVYDTYKEMFHNLYLKYGEPEYGRTRFAFIDDEKEIVYKIPRNYEGEIVNYRELAHDDPSIPLAKCKISNLISKDKGIIIEMEKVIIPEKINNKPEWAAWVDSSQIGLNKQGEYVAYDL